jgi:hypothetical protein
VLRGSVSDRRRDADARRVDEHVEAAVRVEVGRDDACAVLLVPHVGGDRRSGKVGRGLLQPFDLPRDERQVVALVPQHARDREPDARRATDDEGARHAAMFS